MPFLIAPAELSPLARQIVYTSLVGLSGERLKKAVLDAVAYQRRARSVAQLAGELAEVASPIVQGKSEGGKTRIDVAPNRDFDKPIIDSDLHDLPETQCAICKAILASLPENAPKSVRANLSGYEAHLRQRGIRPIVNLLRQFASAVDKEHVSEDSAFWGAGLDDNFRHFFGNNALIMAHFPLEEKRERILSETPIDEDKASGASLRQPIMDLKEAAQGLSSIDLTTAEFDQFVGQMAEMADELSFTGAPPGNPPSTLVTPKRRYVLAAIGFLGTLYAFLGDTVSIMSTPQGKALYDAAWAAFGKFKDFLLQ